MRFSLPKRQVLSVTLLVVSGEGVFVNHRAYCKCLLDKDYRYFRLWHPACQSRGRESVHRHQIGKPALE
jgi:hypothetical protein